MLSEVGSAGPFVLGRCTSCAAPGLTYVDCDEEGSLLRRCLRCDDVVSVELVPIPADQLDQNGYAVVSEGGSGGCGSGGCGSGGCGIRARA